MHFKAHGMKNMKPKNGEENKKAFSLFSTFYIGLLVFGHILTWRSTLCVRFFAAFRPKTFCAHVLYTCMSVCVFGLFVCTTWIAPCLRVHSSSRSFLFCISNAVAHSPLLFSVDTHTSRGPVFTMCFCRFHVFLSHSRSARSARSTSSSSLLSICACATCCLCVIQMIAWMRVIIQSTCYTRHERYLYHHLGIPAGPARPLLPAAHSLPLNVICAHISMYEVKPPHAHTRTHVHAGHLIALNTPSSGCCELMRDMTERKFSIFLFPLSYFDAAVSAARCKRTTRARVDSISFLPSSLFICVIACTGSRVRARFIHMDERRLHIATFILICLVSECVCSSHTHTRIAWHGPAR